MKDFDEFESWFKENCADEYHASIEEIRAAHFGPDAQVEDLAKAFAKLMNFTGSYRLRKYHEWLSSQL